MLTLENITEADLRGPLNAKSLRRARGYINRVYNPVRRGQTLTAQVQGTQLYDVEVEVGPDGIDARCSCPYDWGGYCKHVGALLLKWIQSPGSFAVEEPSDVSSRHSIAVTSVEPPPTHRPRELPPWLSTSLADRRANDEQQLSQWLNEISVRELRQMAKRRGWRVKGVRKAEIIQQLVEHITDPDETLKTVLDLDGEHRQVLCALLLLGDEFSAQRDALERVATIWGRLKAHKQIETYTRHLCEVGLAMPAEAASRHPHSGEFIPRSVARNLPPMLDHKLGLLPAPDRGPSGEQPSGEVHLADPYALPRAVSQIILLLEQSPSPLRPPMPRPRLEKFYPSLREWDYDPNELARARRERKLHPSSDLVLTVPPPRYSLPDETIEWLAPVAGGEARLEFIFSLLMAAGIFQPGSPVTAWPEVKKEFLRRDPLAQRAILARTYFQMTNWSALWELLRRQPPELKLRRVFSHRFLTPERLRANLVGFRHLVLRTLASLPDGRWVAMEDLLYLLRVIWPRFDQTAWQTYSLPRSSGSWFLTRTDSKTPLHPANSEHWELAQGEFIRTMITGPLHWLGLADLSFERGKLKAIRFHGLGDLFWDRVEVPPAPPHAVARGRAKPPEEAIRLDHHTIKVQPSAISGQAHGLLDKIARLERATADWFVYRLDPQAAYEAFEAGTTLSEVLEGWDRLLPIPMPEAIRAQLTDWWEAYGQVRIYENLTVIEFGDDYALAEMKAVTSLEKHLIAEISPRLVIIPQNVVELLISELEEAGHTPKQTSEV